MSRTPPVTLGWPLLPRPDESGRLSFPSAAQSVRESIQVLLLTRPGEQLMRPEFGAGLENFAFEPNTVTTRRRIRDAITDNLSRWEDRIRVDRIDVWEVPERPTHVRVEIAYRLRSTGQLETMALSMDLEG